MSWHHWADELRHTPQQAVADLLRGAADIGPFERVSAHEFLLAVLPRDSRIVSRSLLGEPHSVLQVNDPTADLPAYLDAGLLAWLLAQRHAPQPSARKLGAFAAQVCEALQLPLYFALPQTRSALQAKRAQWLKWLGSLTLSGYLDPEFDYWQVLASQQADNQLQFFWQSFVVEAGRTRSSRYLNLGLLALAKLPLSEDDSLRNLRLQVQALVNRYQRHKGRGTAALEELAHTLRGVLARNPSLSAAHYLAFLTALLSPLGGDKTTSVLGLLGLSNAQAMQRYAGTVSSTAYELKPPGSLEMHNQAVQDVRQSGSLAQAWQVILPLLSTHEDFLHKSGDAYYFVRNLDRCSRALCEKYTLHDPEIQSYIFQWIHLALRVDSDNSRLWMLWELALRQAGLPQRAQWVLWEMTRRFPDDLPCRVELARLLATSDTTEYQDQARRLLQQVLQQDPGNLHAHSTLAQLAIHRKDWPEALEHAQRGLQIAPNDGISAVLLASAYARRNGPDDLQTAIDHLQRFVIRHSGQVKAEDYLGELLQRQQSSARGRLAANEYDEESATTDIIHPDPDPDPAWRAFAESIRSWVAASTPGNTQPSYVEDTPSVEGILPFPQALRRAVVRRQWDTDVLDRYDTTTLQEFPLETRLWRYLQALHSTSASVSERNRAKQALQAWHSTETREQAQAESSWASYLQKQLDALNAPTEAALAAGAEWLEVLLDRYQPLPAPLFA